LISTPDRDDDHGIVHPFQRRPIEPPPCPWAFPDPRQADPEGPAAIGADLEPATLVAAYRTGLFPMPFRRRSIGWWSPDPRGIMPLDAIRVSRSLRRSRRRFEIRFDTCFIDVMNACGDPRRPHGWITPDFISAYGDLHRRGFAHSVECFDADGELVGGLYGVRVGALFAGESMFHRATDASKVALLALVDAMVEHGLWLLDVQWSTDHLASLGAVAIPRSRYLELLAEAISGPGSQPG
jgi:leucyl/phenylalanyl-tRNA--protein transferase